MVKYISRSLQLNVVMTFNKKNRTRRNAVSLNSDTKSKQVLGLFLA